MADNDMVKYVSDDVVSVSTLAGGSREDTIRALNALTDAESLNEHVGEVLTICDVVAEPGKRQGRGGMPDVECTNIYLIATDGTAYFTQSSGVLRAVLTMLRAADSIGLKDGIDVTCIEKSLANGNTIKTLRFA